MEEITTTLDSNAILIKAGVVSKIIDNGYVIDAGKNAKYYTSVKSHRIEPLKKIQFYIN